MNIVNITTQSGNYRDAQLLLESFGLFTSDINDQNVKLWSAEDDGRLVGIVGIEQSLDIGLLRSLAVSKECQGLGVAKRLCDSVFDYAVKNDIEHIFLLTEDASDFFKHIGFIEIDRKDAPIGLRSTAQFSSLCPDNATVMKKTNVHS